MQYITRPWLKFYPEGAPSDIDVPLISLPELMEESFNKYGEKIALIFSDRKLSYRELKEFIDRFAGSIKKLGVKKGDKVALYLTNCPQFAISYFAVLKIGATVTAISPLHSLREVEYQIKDSEARVVICLDMFYRNISKVENLENIIVTNISEFMPQERRRRVPPSILEREKVHSFQKLLEGEPELEIADINPKEEIAALSYTGGTTGLPKGVILTHFNLVSNIYQMKAFTPYLREGNEVVTALLPFYHIYGQVVIMSASLSRGHTLLVFHGLNIEELLSSVEKYRATLFLGVPTLYNMIMGHPALGKYDLSSINYCISGADILHHETSRRFRELTGGKIIEGYGLTETSPATHFNPPERAKEGSIGIPITGTFAGIVDEGGEWAPIGEVGEIVISGPQVMLGYWKREDETKKVLMEKDGRVWLRTGDIGRVDDEGYFYFVEREKDLIKYKGYSVFPKEVEDALLENPAIKEAGVIGIRDEKVGEIVKACVVPEKEWIGKVTEEEIKEWCRERLAVYKVPKIIEFVRSIPKTPVGKVLRRSLREK